MLQNKHLIFIINLIKISFTYVNIKKPVNSFRKLSRDYVKYVMRILLIYLINLISDSYSILHTRIITLHRTKSISKKFSIIMYKTLIYENDNDNISIYYM